MDIIIIAFFSGLIIGSVGTFIYTSRVILPETIKKLDAEGYLKINKNAKR